MPELRTSQPHATGHVFGDLAHIVYPQYYGLGRYSITVDPKREKQFHLQITENWGPQGGDRRDHSLRFDRAQAVELRDALTAALEWKDEE